jgi:DNA-directed RNA polymerase subunit RPC12/RpoP
MKNRASTKIETKPMTYDALLCSRYLCNNCGHDKYEWQDIIIQNGKNDALYICIDCGDEYLHSKLIIQ